MSTERRPGARLPADEAYWKALAARSIDAAYRRASDEAGDAVPSATARAATPAHAWWRDVAASAFPLAAGAVLALLGGALLLGEPSSPAPAQPDAIARALAPDDPMLRSLLVAPADAPPAAILLTLVALREDER